MNVGACPQSALAKAVRNVTAGQSFTASGPTSTTAKPGDTIEYRLTYTNTGDAPATGVVITEPIPDRSTFQSCSDSCTTSPTTVTWNLGTVAAGGTRVVTFQTKLDPSFPAGSTDVKNVATVKSNEEPSKPSNETTVAVTAAPKLALEKSANVTRASAGDQITYTLRFSNTGDAPATETTITERIPDDTRFVSCTGSCTTSGSPPTSASWPIGTVNPGETGSVSLTVEVLNTVGCQICNTATIRSADQGGGAPISSNQVCIEGVPGPRPENANANDSAFGARVNDSMLGVNTTLPTPQSGNPADPSVRSSQHGVGSDSDGAQVLNVAVPAPSGDILSADVLRATTVSQVTAQPAEATHTSTSETVGVNVLNGTVTADVVRAVAVTNATGSSSSTRSQDSTFKNLKVQGVAFNDVAPNTRVDLPAAAFGAGSYVILYERNASTHTPSGLSGGTYEADLTVNMIHVHVTDRLPLVPGDQTTEVIVSNANAHSDFPQTTLCREQPKQAVSGHAFIASETTDPTELPLLAGFASIPWTGGDDNQHLDTVMLPADGSVVDAAASDSSSTGSLSANQSTASSYAQATDACVLTGTGGCTLSATLVKSQANSSADAGGASSSPTGTQLVGVVVNGTPASGTPPPNTVIDLDGLGYVVLNEQLCDNQGTLGSGCSDGTVAGQTGLTVRAIHVVVTTPANPTGLRPGAEVIVAEAHSDALFE